MPKKAEPKLDQETVLARWRETRSPRLADLLCCVPVDREWVARLARIAEVTQGHALPGIKDLPDDPRTTLFLVERLQDATWRDRKSQPLWTVVFARLVRLRDVRCIPALRAMSTKPPDFFQPKTTRWVADQLAKVADKLAKLAIPKDDARTVRLAEAQAVEPPKQGFFPQTSTDDVDALLARVWQAPDDLELRAVIGDALQELGDPRGELIALQLSGKALSAAKIQRLLDEHGERFAGPLARVCPIHHQQTTFSAGFLEACRVGSFYVTKQEWDEAAIAPQWATIVRVEFCGDTKRKWFKQWWAEANLTSLREITMCGVILARSSADAPWRLERTPSELREYAVGELSLLFGTMPKAELARIDPPSATHPLGQLMRTLAGTKPRRA